MEPRIRFEGRHPVGFSAPILSPAFLLRKLALLSLAVTTRAAGRKREEASRVM
ncbi:MAG TPA: hypothetical protein VHB77_06260 [Planctomycetaceae bacterium]|nr:hypothetical protein [Planctomycetaceae bacterium]